MGNNEKKKSAVLNIIALILIFISVIMFYMGYDKMTKYYNSDKYPDLNKNAYVGGDAYNYIINGNYATGFFVLGSGCVLTATVLFGTGLILDEMQNIAAENKLSNSKSEIISSEDDNTLPEL